MSFTVYRDTWYELYDMQSFVAALPVALLE